MPALRYFVLLVYTLLWIASLGSFVLSRDFYPKEFENRTWAAMPAWSVFSTDPHEFFKKTTDHIADYFGLRSSFIRLHNVLKYVVFHTSPTSIVLPGKDGWLFYVGDGNLAFDRNVTPFTETQVNELAQRLQKTQAWLSKRGILFMVVIPPDPPSIYPDKLPDWVIFLPGPTRRQQIIAAANRFMRIPILDLVPDLQKTSGDYSSYFHTGSHWNKWGAFVAGRRLFDQLHALNRRIQPLNQKDYRINIVETSGMDLATSMGLPDFFYERQPELTPTASVPSYIKTNILNVFEFTTLCAACPNLKVLMVRDSFGMGLEPFLSSHFREVTYVWTNVISFPQIEQIHPDIVMFEFVERKLMGLPPYEVPD